MLELACVFKTLDSQEQTSEQKGVKHESPRFGILMLKQAIMRHHNEIARYDQNECIDPTEQDIDMRDVRIGRPAK